MTLRLTEDESNALRRRAEQEARSMQDVARAAINRYTTDEDAQFRTMVASIVDRDRDLLDRLAQ